MLGAPGPTILTVAHDGVGISMGIKARVEVQAQVVAVFAKVQHEARKSQVGVRSPQSGELTGGEARNLLVEWLLPLSGSQSPYLHSRGQTVSHRV